MLLRMWLKRLLVAQHVAPARKGVERRDVLLVRERGDRYIRRGVDGSFAGVEVAKAAERMDARVALRRRLVRVAALGVLRSDRRHVAVVDAALVLDAREVALEGRAVEVVEVLALARREADPLRW